MSYLRLLQDKIQQLSEDICSALNVDVTVVDENLVRIGGTGEFINEINKNSPENSLFAKILSSGKPELNIDNIRGHVCKNCSHFLSCKEIGNMAYPIKSEGQCIGVIGFVAFSGEQRALMDQKSSEYLKMLQQSASMIENEINNIKITNKLNMEMAEVNEIINSVNKGIMIVNSKGMITHINTKAIKILGINLSEDRIIGTKLSKIIRNIVIKDTKNRELIGTWNIGDDTVKVLYQINELVLNEQKISTLIGFDELKEIINIAMNYTHSDTVDFSCIKGSSRSLLKVIEKAKIAAQSDSTILLQGDSGTGKELFARAIHNSSPRRHEAFVAINCTSIPENLLESELFGYDRGAFTGASIKGKIGKFELANNGTLFLDEIGDLPLHLQPKLLRVLQEREIMRVGGNTPVKVNVRIICATHRDLEQLVKEKGFRKDLFYRLNVIPLKLPSLKEREGDVLICSQNILNKVCKRAGIEVKTLSREVELKFLEYDWPGNIRELENVLEYAATFSSRNEIVLDDLPDYFFDKRNENHLKENTIPIGSLDELTKKYQRSVLEHYIGIYGESTEGKKMIANELKISLATLYRKLDEPGQ